jgi:hypothetical protein
MFLVANDPVEALVMPEDPTAPHGTVDLAGHAAFAALESLFERIALRFQWAEDRVYVVGHDDVAAQLVPLVVIMVQAVHDDAGCVRTFQVTVSHALIEPPFDFLNQDACEGFTFTSWDGLPIRLTLL